MLHLMLFLLRVNFFETHCNVIAVYLKLLESSFFDIKYLLKDLLVPFTALCRY